MKDSRAWLVEEGYPIHVVITGLTGYAYHSTSNPLKEATCLGMCITWAGSMSPRVGRNERLAIPVLTLSLV